MGDFYEKPHFAMENFKFWKAGIGVENLWIKVPKAYAYAKSGRINGLAYVAVAVFKRYTAPRKKVRENALFESSMTLGSAVMMPSSVFYVVNCYFFIVFSRRRCFALHAALAIAAVYDNT